MRKITTWAMVIALIVFIIDWSILGLKLYDGDYNITVEAWIGLVCCLVMLVSGICRLFGSKCPHCGKLRLSYGRYCPHCGKEI